MSNWIVQEDLLIEDIEEFLAKEYDKLGIGETLSIHIYKPAKGKISVAFRSGIENGVNYKPAMNYKQRIAGQWFKPNHKKYVEAGFLNCGKETSLFAFEFAEFCAEEYSEEKCQYEEIFQQAMELLSTSGDSLGVRSALKQCANNAGIPFGEEMGKFVEWAERKIDQK